MVPKLTARLTLITPIQHPSNRRIAHLLLRISTSTVTRIVSNRSYRRGPKHCDKENKSPRIPTFVYLQDEGKKEPFFGSYLYLLGVYRSYVSCVADRETDGFIGCTNTTRNVGKYESTNIYRRRVMFRCECKTLRCLLWCAFE